MKTIFKLLAVIIFFGGLLSFDENNDDQLAPNPEPPTTADYPTENLVAYFPFDGDYVDQVSGLPATTVNGLPSFSTDRNDQRNSSVHFTGEFSGGYLAISLFSPIVSVSNNHQATISFWIRPLNTAANFDKGNALYERHTKTFRFRHLAQNNEISTTFRIDLEPNTDELDEIAMVQHGASPVGQFTHVTKVLDDSQRLYINGELVDEDITGFLPGNQYTPIYQAITDFYLGINDDANAPFLGDIDELFFYDRALTIEEINQLYSR